MTNDNEEPSAASAGSVAGDRDILARLRDWRSVHLARLHEVMSEAADEIEHLRTIMYRIVDEDCTVAIQNGTFYADDEPLFAVSGTRQPRNGAVVGPDPDSRVWETQRTPMTQPTPGKGSKPSECS